MFLGAVEFSFYFSSTPTFIKTEFGHFYRITFKNAFSCISIDIKNLLYSRSYAIVFLGFCWCGAFWRCRASAIKSLDFVILFHYLDQVFVRYNVLKTSFQRCNRKTWAKGFLNLPCNAIHPFSNKSIVIKSKNFSNCTQRQSV